MTIEEKRVPRLRFREFYAQWNTELLDNLGEFKNGLNKSKEDFGFGYPFVNLMDIFGKSILIEANFGLVNATVSELKNYNLLKGDVLFVRSSIKPEGVGEAVVVLDDLLNTVYSGFLIRFREFKEDILTPQFKMYCFQVSSFRRKLLTLSTTSANTNINQETLASLNIFFPLLSEQQKIANFLSSVDEKINLLQQKKTAWENYKKGAMQQIFSQKIRFKDDAGQEFPEWEDKQLGELSNITTGSSNREDSSLIGRYTFFDRSQDIRTSDIYLFDAEAVIIAGEGQEFIPKFFRGKFDLHQRTYAIMDFSNLSGKFLFFYIHQNRNYFFSQAVGSTVKSLRLPMFKKMPILVPTLAEQQKIANFLSTLDDKISAIDNQINAAQKWKKGLMQQMFV